MQRREVDIKCNTIEHGLDEADVGLSKSKVDGSDEADICVPKSKVHGSDEVFDCVCSPCLAENKTMAGVTFCVDCQDYYCQKCLVSHKRFPGLSSHILIPKSEFQSKKVVSTLPLVPTERCKQHPTQPIDLYCKTHQKVVCSTCVALEHISCERHYIPDSIEDLIETINIFEFAKTCKRVTKAATESIERVTKNIRKLSIVKDNAFKEMQTFLNELKRYFDEIERKDIGSLDKECTQFETRWSADIADLNLLIENLSNYENKVNSATQNKSQQFVCMSLGIDIFSCIINKIAEIHPDVDKATFIPNPKLTQLLKSVIDFGTTELKFARARPAIADAKWKHVGAKILPSSDPSMMPRIIVVAAICIDATQSTCSWSFTFDYNKDPLKVHGKIWRSETDMPLHVPSSILIKPDGVTPDVFGFDAQEKYADLEMNEQKGWYYFHDLQQVFDGTDCIGEDSFIKDVHGKKLRAELVLSSFIRFMADDLLNNRTKELCHISLDDVAWILPIRAVWNDSAKTSFRKAARKAGIRDHTLTVILKPEAASLYFRHLPPLSSCHFESGPTFMILDVGELTVDVTLHIISTKDDSEELHAVCELPYGRRNFNQALDDLFTTLVGDAIVQRFKESEQLEHQNIMTDFSNACKGFRNISSLSQMVVTRNISRFSEIVILVSGQTLQEHIHRSPYNGKVTISSDKLRISTEIVFSLFEQATRNLLDQLSALIRDPIAKRCTSILMVGTFSEYPIFQDIIKKAFSYVTIVVAEHLELAIPTGAVIYGHKFKA